MTTRGSAAYGVKPQYVSVKDFGAKGDGTTDDTAAFTAAVAKIASTGGVITVPRGNYVTSSAITISNDNIQFDMQDAKFTPTGSTSFAVFDFEGTGVLGSPTLNSNAAIYAKTVSLTTLASLVAGGYLMLGKSAPDNGGAAALYWHISKVRSISGSGPYTVTLVSPLPVAFNTADTGLQLKAVSMLDNVGIRGNCVFDGSVATGTTVHGIKAQYVKNSRFSGFRGLSLSAGSALLAQYGHNNVFENGTAEACGNASFDAHFVVAQNGSIVNSLSTENGSGFGIQVQSCSYCTGSNLISEGSVVGRGVKFAACLECSFTNMQAHGAVAANGVAVSIGTCRCNFFGINANANATSEGLWLSDQYNINNTFHGVVANGNGTRDIHIGTTDTDNVFLGGYATTIYLMASNATTRFLGMNGIPLQAGYSSNAPLQVVSTRQTGWSATTGTLLRTNFGDASLSDTSQALRALITDLKTHGIIGA